MHKQADKNSYSQIVKSSSLLGGAQGVNMLIGFVRVKFAALLIGAAGIGLISAYQSVIQLLGGVFGLGLKSSSVREISLAVANDDEQQLSRSVITLRRMSLLSGLVGAVVVAVCSRGLSQLTFASSEYALEISFVGLSILFTNLLGAEMGAIQGMRRIQDLAKIQVWGGVLGSAVSVCFYVYLGKDGVVFAVVALVFIQMCVSFWYSRKVSLSPIDLSWRQSFREAGGMVRLGLAFMWGALLTTGVAYATRALIVRELDLVAVGIFSAAYALSGMLVNFILSAMAGDYYPSLTAVSSDHAKMQALVNQQTEVGLLLALPGILGTLVFAPLLIQLFYTVEFWQSELLLRWFILGCLLKVISWPMGFVMLATGATHFLIFTQTVFNLLHVLAIWLLLGLMGVEGTAIAFCILYAVHIFLVYGIARYLIGFRWSAEAKKIMSLSIAAVVAVLTSAFFLTDLWRMALGGVFTMIIALFCLRALVVRLGADHRISNKLMSIPVVQLIFR